ncbi:hypothetical protein BGW42_006306 [Actinomortierella wolfii]|nr:hypothetical protein BGW42_006306 [Actinomortierella wolfii]
MAVKPPTPPPKDPAYLESLRMFNESAGCSRSQFHLHGGVISSGGVRGRGGGGEEEEEIHGGMGHSKRRGSPRSTTGKSASTSTNGRGRKGFEKMRAVNRALVNKLQSVKQLSLWPSSKHFCWSSIATASDPSPLTSHMHNQFMQHRQQEKQQQQQQKQLDAVEEKQQQQQKQQQTTPGKKDKEKKRRSFFPFFNSKRSRRSDKEPVDVASPPVSKEAVPSHHDDHHPRSHNHNHSSSHLLTAGIAAGTGGSSTAGVQDAGATPSSSSGSSPSKCLPSYEYPQYQEQLSADKSTIPTTTTPAAPIPMSTATSAPTPNSTPSLPTFVTGPEHWYHLALQLESSVLLKHQLQAKRLFTKSAESGFAPAQFKLGICYELGLVHFTTDPSQSFYWYRKAALQGHADAELAISGWYLTGHSQGLGQSDELAYEWAHKAALRGWSKAEYTLGHYHEVGIGVTPDLQVAKQWYLKAASRGNERALLRLLVGHVGLEVDYAHLKDALLALNQGNPYLIHQLAQFHELREYGLVPDEDTAFELYAASAQADYAPAQYKLGACYEFGNLGCPQDPVQAVEWYRRGAENGHVEALLALAGFFLDGSAGHAAPQSDEEAFRYVRMAALRGVPKAEYIAGFFLEYGLGSTRHIEQAKQWYRLACAKGVESAEKRLRVLEREASR